MAKNIINQDSLFVNILQQQFWFQLKVREVVHILADIVEMMFFSILK